MSATCVCHECGSADVMPVVIRENDTDRYRCENCDNKMFSPNWILKEEAGDAHKEYE